MTIVAYGYGISEALGTNFLTDDVVLSLVVDPDIVLEPDISIELVANDVVVEVEEDIEIEVD